MAAAAALRHTQANGQGGYDSPNAEALRTGAFPFRSEDGAAAHDLPEAPLPGLCPVTCTTEKSIPLPRAENIFTFTLNQGSKRLFLS